MIESVESVFMAVKDMFEVVETTHLIWFDDICVVTIDILLKKLGTITQRWPKFFFLQNFRKGVWLLF